MEQENYSVLEATKEVLDESLHSEWESVGKTYLQMKKYYDDWSVLARKTEKAIKSLASEIGLSTTKSPCSCDMYSDKGDMIIEVTFEGSVFLLFQLNRFANIVTGGDVVGLEFTDNHVTMKINIAETKAYFNALPETEETPVEEMEPEKVDDNPSLDNSETFEDDGILVDEKCE